MSKAPIAFMQKYKIDSDETWEVRRGGAWAVKHSALERVATEQGIKFDDPKPLEARGVDGCAALIVTGHMGERTEWSIGEAAPGNNKNAYPFAMAEKRGKDRVILKLLNSHGALYSEAEADDFAPARARQNPHVTRPDDIADPVDVDEHGQPIDNIPLGDETIERLPKAKAKADWEACQREIRAAVTVMQCDRWGEANANRVASFPADWQEILRGIFREHRNSVRPAMQAAE